MAVSKRIRTIVDRLPELSPYQLDTIDRVITQLQRPACYERNPKSWLVTAEVLRDFGDALRIHHVFSAEALSKDRFEYALERVLQGRGMPAERAPRGNPGHDITILNNVRCSLKTQANKNIRSNLIHISKFMELGKGEWTDKLEHLQGMLDRFVEHLARYERIFTLRRLKSSEEHYELVEIPKDLLLEARSGKLRISSNSKQNPKPGYCTVTDAHGELKFELYFDGGTERKLQVRSLRKDLCIVHATWRFPRQEADQEPVFNEET